MGVKAQPDELSTERDGQLLRIGRNHHSTRRSLSQDSESGVVDPCEGPLRDIDLVPPDDPRHLFPVRLRERMEMLVSSVG